MRGNVVRQTTKGKPERKIVSISVKRQITIPRQYYTALGFDNEAECILQGENLLIRPVRTGTAEFSEQILSDLIAQNYEGQALLEKFMEHSRAVRPAVRKLLDEADRLAEGDEGRVPMEELFERS